MNSASLSQVLLNPQMPVQQSGGATESTAAPSFAQYLQQRADQQRQQSNQLGTTAQEPAASDQATAEQDQTKKKASTNQNAAALLLAVLNQMKQMASQGAGTNGAFVLQGVDPQQFKTLLQSMGLGADEAGKFAQFLSQIDSPLRLDDFLSLLANRLQKLTQANPVTIKETDLPFIQSLLDRFGVSASQIQGATDPAVTGADQLDLQKLIAGLKKLENATPQGGKAASGISLSSSDLDQLRDILSETGLAGQDQQAMLRTFLEKSGALGSTDLDQLKAFLQQKIDAGQLPVPFSAAELASLQPDKLAAILKQYGLANELPSSLAAGKSVDITLDQLTTFLDKVAAAVQGQRPKVNVASFAANLDQLLGDVRPGGQQPVWTPLMANSLQQVYDQLRKLVNFSKVSVSGKNGMALKDSMTLQQKYLAEEAGLGQAADGKGLAGQLAEGEASATGDTGMTADEKALLQAILGGKDKSSDPSDAAISIASAAENLQSKDLGALPQLAQQTANPSVGAMEQQILEQISKGVLDGVKNGEHHLVLKLHPPELGEVKVDLTVHHDHVSVSFAMDNSKVKQAMENNMQQFRDNLEQRGFVLQNCFVSVSDGNDQNEAWRHFEQQMQADTAPSVRSADLPAEMLYQQSAAPSRANGGISIFI